MREIEILGGGGGEVTGSALVATGNKGDKYLIDCGMHQGQEGSTNDNVRNRNLGDYDPNEFTAVFVTHAHIDHIGRLPLNYNSDAPIYMTPQTYDLAKITLTNSCHLSPDLYGIEAVNAVLERTIPTPYNEPISVDGVVATFRDAGHILGSSSLEIQEQRGERLVFSGDLGNSRARLARPATFPEQADIVVMETTYGDRAHSKEKPVEVITEAIERIKKNKGTLLIPTFAIDRTQAMLSILKELSEKGVLSKIPVFLDSPMAIEVTQVYDKHRQILNKQLSEQRNPFNFPELIKTRSVKESKAIHNRRGAKIIIAGSGMMSGGRIEEHASRYLRESSTVILFVGFPAEKTPSRAITEGDKRVLIYGETVDVNATVLQISAMSSHADQQQLLDWLGYINGGNRTLRKVCLVHGSNQARREFAGRINEELGIYDVSLPNEGEIIDLKASNPHTE